MKLILILLFFGTLTSCSNTEIKEDQKSNLEKGDNATTKKFIPWKEDKTIEVFNAPESVAFNGSHYFISNVGGNGDPLAKDKNGYISKLDEEGNIVSLRYIIELDAPKGMAIMEHMLYVADVDKVQGINLKSGIKTYSIDLSNEKVNFLNDICILDDEHILVSATNAGKIFKVNVKTKKYTTLNVKANLTGINGLDYSKVDKKLYVSGFGYDGKANGQVAYLDLSKNPIPYHQIGQYTGNLDGIKKLDGSLLVTDWKGTENGGSLLKIDLGNGQHKILPTDPINGPADFFYNKNTSVIWIPQMTEGKILAKRLYLKVDLMPRKS